MSTNTSQHRPPISNRTCFLFSVLLFWTLLPRKLILASSFSNQMCVAALFLYSYLARSLKPLYVYYCLVFFQGSTLTIYAFHFYPSCLIKATQRHMQQCTQATCKMHLANSSFPPSFSHNSGHFNIILPLNFQIHLRWIEQEIYLFIYLFVTWQLQVKTYEFLFFFFNFGDIRISLFEHMCKFREGEKKAEVLLHIFRLYNMQNY